MWSLKSMSQLSQASSRSSLYYGSHQAGSLGQGQIFTKLALYKGNLVAVRQVHKQTISLERADLLELKLMRDFSHENINPFIGACIEQPNVCVLTQYCPKGSLQDILENGEIKLDAMFKGSLISDLNDGMAYLHNTVLHSHGKLTSGNCLVDSRWVLKVSDYGLHAFKDNTKSDDVGEYEYYRGFLWTAPEIMRMEKKPRNGTQKGDVYSFAIIMQEILFRALPFFLESAPPQDIVDRVRNGELPPFRPEIPKNRPSDVTEGMINLMQVCWQEQEDDRYNFQTIKKQLKAINKGKKFNIMDNMVDKLEKYANNLEDIVEQRTHELLDEKRKTDSLLYRMLPESVANALKAGKAIEAEVFDEVTIYFSDVVGFTSLSSESTPMQVVDLLNDLYSMCDNTIAIYDVYKVETIGDAYMVVSGLPQRNGKKHSMEVANMALDLLSAVSTDFRVRHKPGLTLKLRIGLHTGPCAAGVVGLAMPRYCLFGDSVNMASRMESNGEGFKIHISSATHESLKNHSCFQMTYRGEVALKGKGVQKTYWLLGRDGFNKPLPKVDDSTQP